MGLPTICCVCLVAALLGLSQANVNFYAVGDWGDPWFRFQQMTADAMAEYAATFNPQCFVALGDNFYQNGIHALNDSKIDNQWRYVYNHTTLKDLEWYLCPGNHDYGFGVGEEWYQVNLTFVEPRWKMPHLWHEFTLTDGDVRVQIILIDTQALREEVNDHLVMKDWLNSTLAAATADWVIVGAHHPIFSCGDKGPVSGTFLRELHPILDEHAANVDLYITGHDHNLQLLQNTTNPEYFDYMISGAAGALVYREVANCSAELDPHNIVSTFFAPTFGYTAISASKTSLDFQFIDQNNTLLYEYSRPKYNNGRPKY